MQQISNISIAVMYVMYFLAALFGYLTFYGTAGCGGRSQARGEGLPGVLYRDTHPSVWVCSHGGEPGCHAPHTELWEPGPLLIPCPSACHTDGVESELLHTYSKVDPFDVLILCVRVAVLTAVTLTVPIVLFPVSLWAGV